MKGFKKLALVAAISAAPFAQAELVSMDDSVLSEMTGQAGITIELDTALTIESITYTDTDGADTGNGGSLDITGVAFGGSLVAGGTQASADTRLNDLKIEIDVDADNGLVIHLGGTDSKNGLLGVNPVDFGLSIDSVGVSGLVGDLASNIAISGNLGPIDIIIDGDGVDAANDLIDVKAYFEVTSGSLDVPVIGLGITNLKIGQDSSPIVTGAYKQDIVTALGLDAGGTTDAQIVATANAAGVTALTPSATGTPAIDDPTNAAYVKGILLGSINGAVGQTKVYTDAYAASIGGATDPANPTGAEVTAAESAGDGAVVQLKTDLADTVSADTALETTYATANAAVNPGNATNMAFVALTVGTGTANYSDLVDGDVQIQNALIVNITDFNIDISMDLTAGEKSIDAGVTWTKQSLGSIAIQDLNMAPVDMVTGLSVGTTLKIYGH